MIKQDKNKIEKKPEEEKKPVFIEKEVKDEEILVKKERTNKKPVKEKIDFTVLEEIYEQDKESPQEDFKTIKPEKRKPQTIIIGLLVFFAALAAVSWAGFFIFKPYSRFEGNGLSLNINGPDFPKAGEVETYEFEYKNNEKMALATLEMRLVVPDEFHIIEATPVATSDPYTWQLGSLGSGKKDKITLKGFFLGPGNGSTAFQNIASYRPGNINSDFESITTKQILMSGTVLEGAVTGPEEILPGQEAEYKYVLKHTGEEPLENIVVQLESTNSFLFKDANPETTPDNFEKLWKVSRIEPGTELTYVVHGHFAGDSTGKQDIGFSVGIENNEDRLIHRTDIVSTDVLKSDLDLKLIINGSDQSRSLDFGETLNMTLSYENSGARNLNGVVLSLIVEENPKGILNWANANFSVPGTKTGTGYSWTSKELSELKTISSGGSGSIDISVPIAASTSVSGADEIRFGAGAKLAGAGSSPERELQTTPIVITLNTKLELSTEARYFDNDNAPLGSGALPPKVGQSTNLKILWSIPSQRHNLENLKIRTMLPSNVTWTNRSNTSSGVLSWDAATRTVTLSVDGVERGGNALSANFEVQITPGAGDVGKFVALTGDTTVEARDKQTGIMLSKRVGGLTTDMPSDPGAIGRGAVIE